MSALKVEGLGRSFGTQRVLAGVDLTVVEGITAILGSSGCGKTTLLRLVAGFLEPDSGTISLDGVTVAGQGRPMPSRLRRVGYVPQEGALFPHLDLASNIAFGLPRALGRAARRARVEELLDLVELPHGIAGRAPHEVSGGQQQRVALARALAPAPAVVLLDEPFSSLDASLREETGRAVVRALRASGAAALLVTHDQGEALSLADQVAVMAEGRFLQVAPPQELYLSPHDARVAAFVGHATLLSGSARNGFVRCELGAVTPSRATPDGPVQIAVRPEQLTVRDPGGVGVEALVLDISFFGHDATVRVRLASSGTTLLARMPASSVPRPGERVGLEVVGPVVVFPDAATP